MRWTHRIAAGALAGAAGTVALEAATYADMAARGRPSSELPAQAAERLARRARIPLGADESAARNRSSGLGALLGYAVGVAVAAGYAAALGKRRPNVPVSGALLAAGAMAAADTPLVLQGLTDPRRWGTAGWMADLVPHLVYGLTAAATLHFLDFPST